MAYLVKPFQKHDLRARRSRWRWPGSRELVALEARGRRPERRLEARKLVDRAKASCRPSTGLAEPEAFRWIQRTSMDERRTMRAVAQDVARRPQRRGRDGTARAGPTDVRLTGHPGQHTPTRTSRQGNRGRIVPPSS